MIVGDGKVVAGDSICFVGCMTPACVSAAVSAGLGVSVGFDALVHAINTDSDKSVVSERVSVFRVVLLVMNTPLACVRFHVAIETSRPTMSWAARSAIANNVHCEKFLLERLISLAEY